ncbi:hypothetical protein ACA910_002836 [Epithemia clementina (nom. ined.)]
MNRSFQMKLDDYGSKRAEKSIDSAEKLQRKREAARIRQQRCRARKRAAAAAALESRSSSSSSRRESLGYGDGLLPEHCLQDTSPIAIKRSRSSKTMVPTPTAPSSGSDHHQQQDGMIMTTPVNTSQSGYGQRYSPIDNTTPLPFHGPSTSVTVGPPKATSVSHHHHHPYYMGWYPHPIPAPPGHWMMPPPHQTGMPGYHMPHPIPPSSTHHTCGSSKEKESSPPIIGMQSHTSKVPPVTVSSTPKSSSPQHAFFPFASPLLPTPVSNHRVPMGRPSNSSSLPAATPIKPSKELELEANRSSCESDSSV